jgi:hypothetical protein
MTAHVKSTLVLVLLTVAASQGRSATLGIDTGGRSWGLWANSGGSAAAFRSFVNPLATGQVFQFSDCGDLEPSPGKGRVRSLLLEPALPVVVVNEPCGRFLEQSVRRTARCRQRRLVLAG